MNKYLFFIFSVSIFLVTINSALGVAINQTNTTGTNVYIHGGNSSSGGTGYADLNVINATHGQLINQTLTGWVCATNQCNLTIVIDNDLFNSTNWTFRITNYTRITGIYYNASDSSWRNISELPALGQGSFWNWTRNSSQVTLVNYTLAGGDGYDYGIRDALAGGSYWLNENGTSLETGLVGYWKFAEGSGTVANDSSGGTNPNGTVSGATWITNSSCRFGSCLSFDGTNDVVEIGDDSNLEGMSQLTVGAWIRTSATAAQIIVSKWFSGPSTGSWNLRVNNNNIDFTIANSTGSANPSGTSTITNGVFHFLVATYDGRNIRLYVDGNLEATLGHSGDVQSNTKKVFIGARDDDTGQATQFFNGLIDEVRVYNRVLSSDEIKRLYESTAIRLQTDFLNARVEPYIQLNLSNSTDRTIFSKVTENILVDSTPISTVYPVNTSTVYFFDWKENDWKVWQKNNYIDALVGYWKLDEGQGNTTDSSGQGNNGTLGNGTSGTQPTWVSNSSCRFGSCLFFDGTNDFVNVTDSSSLDFPAATSFSISFWMKTTSSSGRQMILTKTDPNTPYPGYFVDVHFPISNNIRLVLDGGVPVATANYTSASISDGSWHFLTMIADRNTNLGIVYFDGLQVNSTDISAIGSVENAGNLNIGERTEGSDLPFDGTIDEVKIWKRTLMAEEVKAEYLNAKRGMPDWTDPRFKETFKWRQTFDNHTTTTPQVNFTYLLTAADPFVRIFVDSRNATNDDSHNITIPINSLNKTMRNYTDKNAEYFITSGGATEEVYFATQNWKNNTHNFYFRNSSTILNYTYDFNSTLNNNFLFSLGYFGIMSTTNFDATQNQTGFSNETLEQVANSTLTYYDLSDNKLVGWWKFNDGNTIAGDSSGFNNTGTLNANVTWLTNSSCLSGFGYCLSFNGSRNNITIPDSSSLDIGGDRLTVTAWINLRATGAQVVLRKSVNAYNLSFDSSTRPTFYVNTTAGGNQVSDTVAPPTNTWIHIAGVYDGNTLRIYVNGSERANAPNNGTINASAQDLIIGSNDWTGNNLNALLDNVKIFARALTAEEIFWEYQNQKENYPNWFKRDGSNTGNVNITHVAPTSWNYDGVATGVWHFDEGSGNFTADFSGDGNVGTLGNNTVDYRPTWITNSSCKYGNCLYFSGSSASPQFLELGTDSSLDLSTSTSEITLEAWIKTSATDATIFSFRSSTGGNPVIDFVLGGDGVDNAGTSIPAFLVRDDNGGGLTHIHGTTAINDSKWHHVVTTRSSSKLLTIYVDGILAASGTDTMGTSVTTNKRRIGNEHNNPTMANFNGTIDEVRIYPRALTDYEVYEHYSREVSKYYDDFNTIAGSNSGKYRYYGTEDSNTTLQPVTPKDTVLHLRFNDNSTVNVTDVSGSGNNGRTANGAVWITNSTCRNNFGGCLGFDGSNDFIELPDSGSLDFSATASFTIVGWFKTGASSAQSEIIVTKQPAGSGGYSVYRPSNNVNKLRFELVGGTSGAPTVDSTPTINDNNWHFFAGVRDNTTDTLFLYIDRNARDSATDTSVGTFENSGTLRIGTNSGGTVYFNGTVDEILVINRSLSADEVYQLYLGGYNRTIGNRTHRIASADGITTTAYNLTDHDSADQQDYDQRKLLIMGSLPEGIVDLNASSGRYKRGDMLNITFNVSSDIVQIPNVSFTLPNGSTRFLQIHNESAAGLYKTNYTFASYDPVGGYVVNVTDDTYFRNATNATLNNTIFITLEATKLTEARRIISRPNQDVYTFGRAYYASDNSSVNSTQMNASYETSAGTTLLGTNNTNSSGDYMFTFRFTYPINFTYIVAINDTYNNQGSNSTTVTFTSRALFAKFVNAYRIGTSKTNDAWRLGTATLWNFTVGSSDPNTRMDASNLTLPYICTYDQAQYSDGIFLSLIHTGDRGNLEYVNFSNVASNDFYRTELKQSADGSSTLLAFGKGNCADVDSRLSTLSGQTVPNVPIGTYALGEVTETKVVISLQYDRLLLNGTDRFTAGNNKLCVKNVKITAGNEPLIDVRRC